MGRTGNGRANFGGKSPSIGKSGQKLPSFGGAGGGKKKALIRAKLIKQLDAFYSDSSVNVEAIDFTEWDKIIDRIAKDLHSGKLKPEDLDREAIDKTYNELHKAGKSGYGEEWISLPGDGKGSLPNELKKNLYMFSGAKLYSQLVEINQYLYDKNGKLRPYNQFEVLARKVNRKYNKNWLRAEYNTARTAAQMAQKWERIQETKDLFPNLKFRTVGDDRVRKAHAELNGIIKPVDDEFWKKYFPPLDWNCRCDVVQTAETPAGEVPKDMHEPMFQGNVGIDGEIFTKKHNFFKLIADDENALRNQELMKLNAPFNLIYKSKTGKKLRESIFADQRTDELKGNREIGKLLIDKENVNVDILAKLDGRIAKQIPNPEYRINGKLGERKTPEGFDYTKTLRKANKQNAEIVVYDLSKNNHNVYEALKNIIDLLNNKQKGKPVYSTIKEVYVVSADRKTILHYIRKKAD